MTRGPVLQAVGQLFVAIDKVDATPFEQRHVAIGGVSQRGHHRVHPDFAATDHDHCRAGMRLQGCTQVLRDDRVQRGAAQRQRRC